MSFPPLYRSNQLRRQNKLRSRARILNSLVLGMDYRRDMHCLYILQLFFPCRMLATATGTRQAESPRN